MKRVVRIMLRRHSALPYALWKAACMCTIQWLHGITEGMRKRSPIAEVLLAQQALALLQQEAGGSDVAAAALQQLPLAAVPAAQIVMTQTMLCEVAAALKQSYPEARYLVFICQRHAACLPLRQDGAVASVGLFNTHRCQKRLLLA